MRKMFYCMLVVGMAVMFTGCNSLLRSSESPVNKIQLGMTLDKARKISLYELLFASSHIDEEKNTVQVWRYITGPYEYTYTFVDEILVDIKSERIQDPYFYIDKYMKERKEQGGTGS